jgi:hypothetical protein
MMPSPSRRFEADACPRRRAISGLRSALVPAGAGLALGILTSAAAAQTIDQVPRARTVTTAESVEADIAAARVVFGPLRLFPMVVIDNAGYDSNVFSAPEGQPRVGDWTVTAGAGGRAVVPMGSKLFLRVTAVPQYIWYAELQDRRTWGGTFGAEFLALGNRLSFGAEGSYDRGQVILNSESQLLVLETHAAGTGKLEVDLTRALSFVASAAIDDYRYPDTIDPEQLASFERTDTAGLAGLRMRVTSSYEMTAGVQGTRSDFVQDPQFRNNETYAIFGAVHLDRPRFYVNLSGGYRKGQGFDNSLFRRYATAVGAGFISWRPLGFLELQVFGHRRPIYSRSAFDQLYVESRYGGGLAAHIGPRVTLNGFAETGTNSYPFRVSTLRVDDALSYGGSVSVLLFGRVTVRASANQNNLKRADGSQRNVFRFITGLSFNEEFRRE